MKLLTIKNRKGQTVLGLLFILFIVGLIWFFGLAPWIASEGARMSADHNNVGLWAFFIANMNIVIGVFYALALLLVARYGL